MAYNEGSTVRIIGEFRNVDNVLTNPGNVRVRVRSPGLVITENTYAAGQVINDSLGIFHYDVIVGEPGQWVFYVIGEDGATASEGGMFHVRAALV